MLPLTSVSSGPRLLLVGVSTLLPRCRAPHINKKSCVSFFKNEPSNCKQLYLRLLERSLSEIPDVGVFGLSGTTKKTRPRRIEFAKSSRRRAGTLPRDSALVSDGRPPLAVLGAANHIRFLPSCCGCTLKVLQASNGRVFTSRLTYRADPLQINSISYGSYS